LEIRNPSIQRPRGGQDQFHPARRTFDVLKSREAAHIQRADLRSAPDGLGGNSAEDRGVSPQDATDVGKRDSDSLKSARACGIGFEGGLDSRTTRPRIDLKASHVRAGNWPSFRRFTNNRDGNRLGLAIGRLRRGRSHNASRH